MRLLSFLSGILLIASLAPAEDLCGIINSPTTLKAEHSPYRVVGDLYVTPSARLTIEAGVQLIIIPGEACGDTRQLDWADSNMISIKVDGALFITGTPEALVRIEPEKHRAGLIQWDGIRIRSKSPTLVQIEGLSIRGAQKAIRASRSQFHIANSFFEDNNTALWLEEEADISAYNNLFTGNRSAAISIRESNPSLLANIFYRNLSYAIDSDSRPKPRIEYNLFSGNGDNDCWRCPAGIGRLSQVNNRGDSTDRNFNLFTDPLFFDSPGAQKAASRDPANPTAAGSAKDSSLYRLYAAAQNNAHTGLSSAPRYIPLGSGPWRLSRYSPALDAAPDTDFFRDVNDTRGDLGLFGGKPGRTRAKSK